jgi:hypothetical protein
MPKTSKGYGHILPIKSSRMENGKSTMNMGNHIQLPSAFLSKTIVAKQRQRCRNGKTKRK